MLLGAVCPAGLFGLVLVAVEVGAKRGRQVAVLLLFGQVQRVLRDGHGLRVVAGLRIHGGEHLQDGGLAVASEFRGGLELRQSIRKSAAGGEGAAEIEAALGGARGEDSTALLQFGDGLVHLAFARQDDAVDVVAVGVLGRDLACLA